MKRRSTGSPTWTRMLAIAGIALTAGIARSVPDDPDPPLFGPGGGPVHTPGNPFGGSFILPELGGDEFGGGPPPNGAPSPSDFGDAPDLGPSCGIIGGIGFFPTLPATGQASAGRDAPYHILGGTPLTFNVSLGVAESYESSPFQSPCDWNAPGCDGVGVASDDGALVLCLTPGCTSGVTISGAICGVGMGACFGPSPGPAPMGFWIFTTTRGSLSFLPATANVVTDWDMTGKFGDNPSDWILVDKPISAIAGFVELHTTSAFPVPSVTNGPMGTWGIEPFWTRFVVGPETISAAFPSGGWDGSGKPGGYSFGETEDWIVERDPGQSVCALPRSCFHSSATLRITLSPSDQNCQNSFSVVLSSAGQPTAMAREFRTSGYVTDRVVPVELTALRLVGNSPSLGGPIIVRERSDRMSIGLIDHVLAGPGGGLASGRSFFDAFIEIELVGQGVILDTGGAPMRLDAPAITAFPPIGTAYQPPSTGSNRVPLFNRGTAQQVGWLCSAQLTPTQNVPWQCPGDANGDRVVNFSDVTAVLVNWGGGGPQGDANNDCFVNFADATAVFANLGRSCP